MSPEETGYVARFTVRNVGGIQRTEIDVPPGVTVLTGKNATNRTSFLQSIRAALGSTAATLKGDADEGSVTMAVGDETYERTLERAGDGVTFAGEGYLADPTVADLFAFLLEYNEARQTVARGGDLREVIMRPVDTEAIRSDIERLEREKDEVTDELDAIESRQRKLPELEARRNSLREDIETKRAELAEREAEIDETDVEQHRQERTEFEETLAELRETRADLETVRRKMESQTESITSLKRERADLEAELEELPTAEGDDREQLESTIADLRRRRQSLNADISELQNLIQYNEHRLDEQPVSEFLSEDGDGSVTDRLVPDEETDVVCWTCGSAVGREQIETTVQRLRDLREGRVVELDQVTSTLEELKSEKQAIERTQRRRREIEAKLADIESERERRETQVESLRRRRRELTDTVGRLEETAESLEAAEFDTVLELHRAANGLEFEIDSLESDLESVTAEIEAIETERQRGEELRDRRDRLATRLTEKRTEIDRIEADAVERFNEHMAAILDILAYENLERIWIERIEETVRDGRGTVDRTGFELHIIRTTANGAAYEDTIDHLSESEREVTGLVFALAGYLVHEVYETVPFILLDSLEAIDADRIANLVDYFAGYATYLVVALLPEDAQALDDAYTRITDI